MDVIPSESFPNEAFCYIFSYVSVVKLLIIRQVSKAWRDFINNSSDRFSTFVYASDPFESAARMNLIGKRLTTYSDNWMKLPPPFETHVRHMKFVSTMNDMIKIIRNNASIMDRIDSIDCDIICESKRDINALVDLVKIIGKKIISIRLRLHLYLADHLVLMAMILRNLSSQADVSITLLDGNSKDFDMCNVHYSLKRLCKDDRFSGIRDDTFDRVSLGMRYGNQKRLKEITMRTDMESEYGNFMANNRESLAGSMETLKTVHLILDNGHDLRRQGFIEYISGCTVLEALSVTLQMSSDMKSKKILSLFDCVKDRITTLELYCFMFEYLDAEDSVVIPTFSRVTRFITSLDGLESRSLRWMISSMPNLYRIEIITSRSNYYQKSFPTITVIQMICTLSNVQVILIPRASKSLRDELGNKPICIETMRGDSWRMYDTRIIEQRGVILTHSCDVTEMPLTERILRYSTMDKQLKDEHDSRVQNQLEFLKQLQLLNLYDPLQVERLKDVGGLPKDFEY